MHTERESVEKTLGSDEAVGPSTSNPIVTQCNGALDQAVLWCVVTCAYAEAGSRFRKGEEQQQKKRIKYKQEIRKQKMRESVRVFLWGRGALRPECVCVLAAVHVRRQRHARRRLWQRAGDDCPIVVTNSSRQKASTAVVVCQVKLSSLLSNAKKGVRRTWCTTHENSQADATSHITHRKINTRTHPYPHPHPHPRTHIKRKERKDEPRHRKEAPR